MTFLDFYKKEKNKPTAAALFVRQMAALTGRSEGTVRQWVVGMHRPDPLAQRIIAKHFGSTPEALFPNAQNS